MEKTEEQTDKRKNSKSRRDTAVQGTNDSSIISKASMVTQGYFEDPFYEYFVNKQLRRAPLINRGYYIRVKTIDHVIRNFLHSFTGLKQIVSVGAGFDTSYFRLKSEGLLDNTIFVEVDFPELVKRKHNLISHHKPLKDLLSEEIKTTEKSPLLELNTEDYKLLGADLTRLNILEAALRLCGVDFDVPTVILSECVLTYITRKCSSSIVGWASETFYTSVFILYEQINPNDGFGLFMQNHFHVVGSPLKCINAYPTIESQKNRFIKQGWKWCEAYNMNQFYYKLIKEEERERIERLEAFDEHEEWHVKCNHYMILLAYSSNNIPSLMNSQSSNMALHHCDICSGPSIKDEIKLVAIDTGEKSFKRYSHISGYLGNQYILTFGGFGEQDGRHQRLTEIGLFDWRRKKICVTQFKIPDIDFPRMHLDGTTLSDNRMVIVGGRNSPYKVSKGVIIITLKDKNINNITDSEKSEGSRHSSPNPQNEVSRHFSDKLQIGNSLSETSRHSSQNVEPVRSTNLDSNQDSRHLNESNSVISENCHNVTQSQTKSNNQTSHYDAISPASSQTSELIAPPLVSSQSNEVKTSENSWILTTELCDFELKLVTESGDIPEPRWRHAICCVNIQGEDYIYLYGGRTMLNLSLNDSYLLNIQTGQWKKLEYNGVCPGYRQSHSLTVWKDNIILYGGLDEQLIPSHDVFILNMATLAWTKLNITGTLYPRYSHTSHIIGDKLVVIGGVNLSQETPGVAIVNLIDGSCREYSLFAMEKDKIILFHQHSAVILPDNNILVIGGGGNCFSFGTHLNSTPFILDLQSIL